MYTIVARIRYTYGKYEKESSRNLYAGPDQKLAEQIITDFKFPSETRNHGKFMEIWHDAKLMKTIIL
jgi:hypothetical protein